MADAPAGKQLAVFPRDAQIRRQNLRYVPPKPMRGLQAAQSIATAQAAAIDEQASEQRDEKNEGDAILREICKPVQASLPSTFRMTQLT